MPITLSARNRRHLSRILPFGLIWLVTGMVFLMIEGAATNNQNLHPDTGITLSWGILLFALCAVTTFGLILGWLEVMVLDNQFRKYSLGKALCYKFLFYFGFILFIQLVTFPIAAAMEAGLGVFHPQIWEKTGRYLTSLIFASTMVQLGFSLFLSLLYSALSAHVGHQVLLNFFTGRYHKPAVEQRIFMFSDMKSSTTIAEALGHVRYFDLLQRYYDAMSNAIVDFQGEVYQYIGDEVVITWRAEVGLENARCVRCYRALKDALQAKKAEFVRDFGVFPDFKAGLHLGEVTTGEIGALKKEIVYSGDILNATARLQGLCKQYHTDVLISEDLVNCLSAKSNLTFKPKGKTTLRGQIEEMEIYTLDDGPQSDYDGNTMV